MPDAPSILFLTSGRREPSSRFRVLQFLPCFRREGIRAVVRPCSPNVYRSHRDYPFGGLALQALFTAAKLGSRLAAALEASRHDVVFVERELLPHLTPRLETLVSLRNPAMHLDFDDAIHLRYGEGARNPVARVIGMVRTVSAGNEYLAAYARRFNPRVSVIPTAVDTDRYAPAPEGDVPFVWTGSSSTLPYLERLAPALRRVPGARLLVICDRRPRALGIPVEFVPWSERVEVEALRRGRVGLMPLPDTEWARGKCGLKLLQYMACGIPCVGSGVGANPEILEGGQCGMLARTEDDWVEALTRLRGDGALRQRLRAAGRRRVESAYSVRGVYPRLRDAILAGLPGARKMS